MTSTFSADATPYLTVHCQPDNQLCDETQTFVVIVTGSNDVVLRFEAPENENDNGDVARVQVNGDSSMHPQHVMAQLMEIDGLPVLQLSATEGPLDVVLRRKQRLERVINQGSGKLTVEEDVLVTRGPSLTIVSHGDVVVTSTTAVTVDDLALAARGSGRLEASFSELHVKAMTVEVLSSGSATVFTASTTSADTLSLSVGGSGAMCLASGASLDVEKLSVDKFGSGQVSLGPRGSCQNAEISTAASGVIDAGGIRCNNVSVDLLSSGAVIVQATEKLSGDLYGSGHLQYSGNAPHSIDNVNYMGLVSATPVSTSYHPSGCESHFTKPSVPTKDSESTSTHVLTSGEKILEGLADGVKMDQNHIGGLAAVVFLVALVLRWFNESRRRAREEQRQPLVGAQRRVYV